MARIVVSGALANKPGNGGDAWTRLSWTLGFKRLGHEVYFVEQISPSTCVDAAGAPAALEASVNAAYFTRVTGEFGLGGCSALLADSGEAGIGLERAALMEIAGEADLLVNISGHLTLEALKPRFRARAFIDLDPGYTQCWQQQGLAEDQLRGHDLYFTVGDNIGTPRCEIPTGGLEWRPIRQPVVLDQWTVAPAAADGGFTTVSSWRGPFGRVSHNGVQFGLKAHEFRKFVRLPLETGQPFEIALDIDPADYQDVELLERHRWTIVNPRVAAPDPAAFRDYVRRSAAEFSVAQGIYVHTQSGWFSDRTVRYLAAGKPALVQDTGFCQRLPAGCGLVPFKTMSEAIAGAEAIAADYDTHARAARAIAVELFDSDKVLTGLLEHVG